MMDKNGKCCGARKKRLCPVSLGFGLGIASGLAMLLLALANMQWGYGTQILALSATVDPGFAATGMGALIGLGWGFLKGFVFGFVVAVFYNLCARCCSRMCRKCCGACCSKCGNCPCTCGNNGMKK